MTPWFERPLSIIRSAVREAGRIQKERLGLRREINHKGRYDLVTDVDKKCEDAIKQIIWDAYPHAATLAEESAEENCRADECWIIDPLDGTTNYAHGFPVFASTVALRKSGQIVLGAVYDPLRDELFEAVLHHGASLNGKRIQVSSTSELSNSLLATGFPYDRCEQPDTNLDRFAAMTLRTQGVRRQGSASLDLCYTACGRLDGYWEIRICPWDVCAGALLVKEAGGQVTNLSGGDYDWSGQETLASNGKLHQSLIESLANI